MAVPYIAQAITAQVAAGLPSGERVLAVSTAKMTDGARTGEDPTPPVRTDTPDRRGPARRAAEGAAGVAVDLVSGAAFDGPDVSRWLAGVGSRGGADSQAAWLERLLRNPGEHYLAATGARLLLVTDRTPHTERMRARRTGEAQQPFELVAEIPASQIASLQHRPKLVARGRMELAFTDGSMLALQPAASVLGKEARALVEAMNESPNG